MTKPDRVWDQCGIQFRAVSYDDCPVPADVFWRDAIDTDICSPFKTDQLVRQALADSCPGFDPNNGAKTVVFTGYVANTSAGPCQINGTLTWAVHGWGSPNNWAYVALSGTSGILLAHELGHVMGLPDTDCEPKTLMCSTDPTLDASSHCAAARAVAATRQDAFWSTTPESRRGPRRRGKG